MTTKQRKTAIFCNSYKNTHFVAPDKCKELHISFASVSHKFPPVVIGGECIKVVTDTKLLGVTISSDLSWNVHITEVIKKGSQEALFSHPAQKSLRFSERSSSFLHHMCALC